VAVCLGNLQQTFATRKSLMGQGGQLVAKLTLCATMSVSFLQGHPAAGGPNWSSERSPGIFQIAVIDKTTDNLRVDQARKSAVAP